MVKSYLQFINESKILASVDFISVLKTVDSKLSKELLNLINKDDVITPFNALDLGDSGDTIKFTSDRQLQRKLSSGLEPMNVFNGSISLQMGAVGRSISKILSDNGIECEHTDILDFVPKWKSAYVTYINKKNQEDFPIDEVRGEEIRDWYLEDNYCYDARELYKGTISKSCMRFEECQDYLDIYVRNPEKISLIILTEKKEGKETLRARALLWNTENNGYYLDRVYYTSSEELELIWNWAVEKYKVETGHHKKMPKLFCKLKPGERYSAYPYMDTMCYYDKNKAILYNYIPTDESTTSHLREHLLYLQDTEGGYEYGIDEDYTDSED